MLPEEIPHLLGIVCPGALFMQEYQDYGFRDPAGSHMHRLLAPAVLALAENLPAGAQVLDVGCGNGALCAELLARGYDVTGIDPSESGVALAAAAHPRGRFHVGFADDRLLELLGEEGFDMVVSTEVIEHVYAPRAFAKVCYRLLRPGGLFMLSTPYHGYLKNLAIALAGKWDSHADPLWDGGHIKLWSRKKLTGLLSESGFEGARFYGVGRVPLFWMSMILAARRP